MDKETILSELRESGIDADEIARRLRVSRTTAWRWLSGRTKKVNRVTAKAIYRLLADARKAS